MQTKTMFMCIAAKCTPTRSRTPKQKAALEIWTPQLNLLKIRKLRFECSYCCEEKVAKDFVNPAYLPWNCQQHLTGANRVCQSCLAAAISSQLDCKRLLDVGCPSCGLAWEPADVRMYVDRKDMQRLDSMDQDAQGQVYVPQDLPDQATLDDLLARGARLCPGCRYPFVKLGGCESMQCAKCNRYFNIAYAAVLEDGKGNRAAEVDNESNADIW